LPDFKELCAFSSQSLYRDRISPVDIQNTDWKPTRGQPMLNAGRDLSMGMLTIQVWDATGNKRQDVTVPDDAPVNRILAVLLEKMNFPQYAPDGQPLSYKFHHRASGKQLLDTQSLSDIGVKEGDVLRLQPEITAGSLQLL
jgi:uncharacterized ubiquitin-like protein YukD